MRTLLALALSLALASNCSAAFTAIPQDGPGWMRLRLKPPRGYNFSTLTNGVWEPFKTPLIYIDGPYADPSAFQGWVDNPLVGFYRTGEANSFSFLDLTPEFDEGLRDITIWISNRNPDNTRTFDITDWDFSPTYQRVVTLPTYPAPIPEPGAYALALVALAFVKLGCCRVTQ